MQPLNKFRKKKCFNKKFPCLLHVWRLLNAYKFVLMTLHCTNFYCRQKSSDHVTIH